MCQERANYHYSRNLNSKASCIRFCSFRRIAKQVRVGWGEGFIISQVNICYMFIPRYWIIKPIIVIRRKRHFFFSNSAHHHMFLLSFLLISNVDPDFRYLTNTAHAHYIDLYVVYSMLEIRLWIDFSTFPQYLFSIESETTRSINFKRWRVWIASIKIEHVEYKNGPPYRDKSWV